MNDIFTIGNPEYSKVMLSKRQHEDMEMYLDYANRASLRSKSERLKVGACVVTEHGGTYTGYNGTLPGFSNCCENDNNETHDGVVHAEANALDKMQKDGVSSFNSIVFQTHSPCEKCLVRMINVGVKRVFFINEYRNTDHLKKSEYKENIEIIHVPENSK